MSTANPVEFRPYEPAFAADPYPVYAELRQRSPVFYSSETGMTLFTRYDDIRGLLLDSRLGRSLEQVIGLDHAGRGQPERGARLPNYNRYVRANLLEKEGADHARLRRLVLAAFSAKRIRELRDRVQLLVDELLRDL